MPRRASARGAALGATAVLLAAALALAACGPGSSAEAGEDSIGPEELVERIEEGSAPLVLDVRTPGEYADGHVPGAVNVPHREIEPWLAAGQEPSPDDEVVVYCESGGRAARAEAALREAGFKRVRHLEGDMSTWRSRDLPCSGCEVP